MSREIRRVEEDDLDALIRIRGASFPSNAAHDPEVARSRLRPRLPWTWGLVDTDGLAAVATWFPYRAWIGGIRTETGSLAGVASSPETRRRGHVRALVLDGLRRLHERGVGFALEHPFDPRFYAALGFRTVPAGVSLDLPIDRIGGDPKAVDFSRAGPGDRDEVVGIHAAYASRWTFALDRDWRHEGEEPGHGPQWRRILGDADGAGTHATYLTRDGYAVVDVRATDGGEVLHVVDAAWRDVAARSRVMALLGAWRGQVSRVEVDLPATDACARDEGARYAVRRPTLQARIVDLPSALGPLRATTGSPLPARVVRVRDALCPWNDGTWRIEAGPEGTTVGRTEGTADAELDVRALVSLLTGTPPAVLLADGEAEGDPTALVALADLTRGHPPHLADADYF